METACERPGFHRKGSGQSGSFWTDRKFNILPAAIGGNRVEAAVPPLTTACFLNLFDDRGCVVSSEHVEL